MYKRYQSPPGFEQNSSTSTYNNQRGNANNNQMRNNGMNNIVSESVFRNQSQNNNYQSNNYNTTNSSQYNNYHQNNNPNQHQNNNPNQHHNSGQGQRYNQEQDYNQAQRQYDHQNNFQHSGQNNNPPVHEHKEPPKKSGGLLSGLLGNIFGGEKSSSQGGETNIIRSLFNMIPSGIYDSKTKKIMGILSTEDLFLIALILMIADSDENDDIALIIALVYIFMA